VDLILATHEHSDHFSPELVRGYLLDNPHAVFVSTQSAVAKLPALGADIKDRVVPIDLKKGESTQIDANGIHLEAIYLSHGIPGLLNLGFIITIGEVRLFHTGDMDPDSVTVSDLLGYGLPDMQLDIAFVPEFALIEADYQALALEGIQARYLIPMHFSPPARPVEIEENFPNAFVFSQSFESWVLPPGETQASAPPPEVVEIGEYVAELAADGQFSGVVLIAQAGELLLLEAYGQANRAAGFANQVDTKFNLGSLDKMFTAVAILQLVEQGKLSLDDKVGTYLPNYANSEVAKNVTLHELLMHTSGMGNYFDSPRYLELHDQIRSVADYLPLFVDTPLQFQPGAQFAYSNSGFIVLGLIIEAVTGQSYYDYVRENILEPSGMFNTGCYELDNQVPNLAIGYTYLNWDGTETDQIHDNLAMMPMRGGSAGGGFSTAPDLLNFGNALLSHRLLSPESTELLLAGKVELAEGVQYAYGFFDRQIGDYRVVGHGGGFPGICSLLNLYLDLGYTTVVLSNSDHDCLAVDEFTKEKLLK
jgi:CubicO group peptidase (beta-lactamase class C family)